MKSLPSRERGLKFSDRLGSAPDLIVAPFAGAWIEMRLLNFLRWHRPVAPFAGAWIEIFEYVQAIADHFGCRSLRGSVD